MPSPESLSPQLSSVESLRSSLPEEHRHLFDSLLQDIKDYCEAHGLPTPSLTSREAFIITAQKNRTPPDVLNHIILLLKRFDYLTEHKEPMPEEPISLTQEQAREIMGRNFLGTKEVEEHFGKLSPEQEESLSIIPFSKETLESCKDTHILVADIGLSIMGIKKLKNCKGLLCDQDWYEAEDFAKHTDQPSWRLIRKTPVENSFGKTWSEQQVLLDPKTEEVPLTRQLIYTILLYFRATGEKLFETDWVRTNDVEAAGLLVHVGKFFGRGPRIYYWDDFDGGSSGIGLASARKVLNTDHPTSSLTP